MASMAQPPDPTKALFRSGPPAKRQRIKASCTECHRRKQKCDREKPCTHCKGRNKPEGCVYETKFMKRGQGLPSSDPHGQGEPLDSATMPALETPLKADDGGTLASSAADWGYGRNTGSTMTFLKEIESTVEAQASEMSPGSDLSAVSRDDVALREKYRALVRQLPSKKYIDSLAESFMEGLNWQYYFIDPDIFYRQLDEWSKLPFSTFTDIGPRGIPPNLRAFPAVLFQVLALSLMLVTERNDPDYDPLRYINSMTLEDVATEYSNAGAAILDVLGTSQITLETVQAQFLRATFFKYTAKITDAWHAISVSIRCAQDLGMDQESMDPHPAGLDAESILENKWLIQRRRRMWAVLSLWDLTCAVILGRPGTLDWNRSMPPQPVDAILTENRSKDPVRCRTDADRPTPVTLVLWSVEIARPLQAIRDLENKSPSRALFKKVDRLHQSIIDLHNRAPLAFKLDNPDTKWDDGVGMEWIKPARFYSALLQEFALMALHRPYVFHRSQSRLEAIQAGLRMLEVQKQTFLGLPPDTWRNHLLFFGSFDAVVLIASTYILYPQENNDLKVTVVQHFDWTVERFQAMQDRNPLAKAAQGVLKAIVARFKKAMSSRAPSTDVTSSIGRDMSNTVLSVPINPTIGPGEEFRHLEVPPLTTAGEWSFPSADSLATLAPMFPTGDIIYNDLNAVQNSSMPSSHGGLIGLENSGANGGVDAGVDEMAWLFGGELGNDTVWQLFNQFPQAGDGDGAPGAAGDSVGA